MTEAWGPLAAPLRLVADRENRVYEMRLADGRRAAFRVHRPGYQSAASIEAELSWTEALAEAGFSCPRPLRTLEGGFLTEASGNLVSSVSWIDATPLADVTVLAEQMHEVGRLLAEFHQSSDTVAMVLDRFAWDVDGLLGTDPLWGRFWENPSLNPNEQSTLLAARDRAQEWLQGTEDLDQGLIHADPLSENILIDEAGYWLIDFDDSGYGYRGYDLGVALVQFWERPDFADLLAAICEGYGAAKPEDVQRFMCLRAMASAGWVIIRVPPNDPKQRLYADRALGCLSAYWPL